VRWSAVLGLFVDSILFFLSQRKITLYDNCKPHGGFGCLDMVGGFQKTFDYGFPVPFHGSFGYINDMSVSSILLNQYSFIFNFFFWFLVFLLILSVIRHFRKKTVQVSSQVN